MNPDFHFAEWRWAYALVPWALFVAIQVLLMWRDRRPLANAFLASPMRGRLSYGIGAWRRLIAILCLAGGFAALILALMRPQWGRVERQLPRMGAEIMICLDVSKSMLAEDVTPNRLERAKAEIRDLLAYLRDERVGLMVFAGRPVLLSPLTSDFGFLKLILENAGPHNVGRGGTRLGPAIQRAIAAFHGPEAVSRVVLLITDGDDLDTKPIEMAKAAKEQGIQFVVVGFGDERGSTIQVTDPRTGIRKVVRRSDGEPVVSRMNSKLLSQIAEMTHGVYVPAGTGMLDLARIHQAHFAPLLRVAHEETKQIEWRHEGFQIPLAMALALFAMASRLNAYTWNRGTSHGSVAQKDESELAALDPFVSNERVQNRGSARQVAIVAVMSITILSGKGWSKESLTRPIADESSVATATDFPAAAPRFNQAVPLLEAAPDEAKTILERTLELPEADQEVRYRAHFNLGWLAAKRADRLLLEDPAKALPELDEAEKRFQESVAIRPNEAVARKNLEIVAQRSRKIREALDRTSPESLRRKLERLEAQERELAKRNAADPKQLAEDQHKLRQEAESLIREGQSMSKSRQAIKDGEADSLNEAWNRASADLKDATDAMNLAGRRLERGQIEPGQALAQIATDALRRGIESLQDPNEVAADKVREMLKEQEQLNQASQQQTAQPGDSPDSSQNASDLAQSQEQLAERAEKLAEQMSSNESDPRDSQEQSPNTKEGQESGAPSQQKQAAAKLRQAAESMREAAEALQDKSADEMPDPPSYSQDRSDAHTAQSEATDQLKMADDLLREWLKKLGLGQSPPEKEDAPPPENEEQVTPEESDVTESAGKQEPSTESESAGMRQLMQLIRDQEAARMRDKIRHGWLRDEPVDEDW